MQAVSTVSLRRQVLLLHCTLTGHDFTAWAEIGLWAWLNVKVSVNRSNWTSRKKKNYKVGLGAREEEETR